MTNKVREVQSFLTDNGIKVSEVAIVNAAIDIVRKSTEGCEAFIRELEGKNRLNQQKADHQNA